MSLRIQPVGSSRDLRRFVDLPWSIYTDDHTNWVPPLRIAVREALDTRKNPFYHQAARELFLAVRDGTVVGRIAAIENRAHNAFHEDRVGFFGFFEAIDDQEVADALFAAAEGWLTKRGLTVMRGPMSPSTNHECGLLIDGFDAKAPIMTTWNPPYYARLLEHAGFVKAKDLIAYLHKFTGPDACRLPDRYQFHARRALEHGRVRFREMNPANFGTEVEACWDVYNAAWEKNWGFIPMKRDEFLFMAKEFKHILLPKFAIVAEVDGVPAGIAIVVPDYHRTFKEIGNGRLLPTGLFKLLRAKSTLRAGRLMMLGVKAQYRNRSIFPLFAAELWRRAMEYGLTEIESSWVLEDNTALNRPMEAMGALVYRTWRVYDRMIETPRDALQRNAPA